MPVPLRTDSRHPNCEPRRAGRRTDRRMGTGVLITESWYYSPELNPVENVWEFLRGNFVSNRVWDNYEAIVDACQDAWNKLMRLPERVASMTRHAKAG